MPKKSCLIGPFKKQHGKRAKPLLKSASQCLCHIYLSLPRQLSWRKSLFLTCKILALLVNTLSANENYPVFNRGNLTIQIQMQLSQKQKAFVQIFAAFFKSVMNFNYFQIKDDCHRFCISEIADSKNVVR